MTTMSRRCLGFFQWKKMNQQRRHKRESDTPRKRSPNHWTPWPQVMFLDGETNEAVVAFKGVIPYSIYKDDTLYCRISNILATKRYIPPILSDDRRLYIWKNSYTYGPWPPGQKKVTPEGQKASPIVTFIVDTSIQDIDPSSIWQTPLRRCPLPAIQMGSLWVSMRDLVSIWGDTYTSLQFVKTCDNLGNHGDA